MGPGDLSENFLVALCRNQRQVAALGRLPAAAVLMECPRPMHERTGQAIEAMFKERIDDHLRQLAITIVGARTTRHCVSNRCQDVPRTSA
jgi:hypothetical protein